MGKLLVIFVPLLICLGISAQTNFEGELHYRNFENYSRNARMFTGGECYNGSRNLRIIIKGDKVHIVDETLNVHKLALPEKEMLIVYSDLTKSGIIKSLYADLSDPSDSVEAKLDEYGATLTSKEKEYKGEKCLVYKGKIVPGSANFNMSTTYEVWCTRQYIFPSYTSSLILQKIKISYIPLKWTYEAHGKTPIIGKSDTFIASELTKISPRKVDDFEFETPKGYKFITTDSQNKLAGFYRDVRKELRKQNKYPGDADADTDITYKIEDEWDF